MREIDGQNPDLRLFAGAKNYRSQESITAVRLTEQTMIRTLFGVDVGTEGDYLCRDRKSGVATIVNKGLFEATYFVEQDLTKAVRKQKKKGMVIQ